MCWASRPALSRCSSIWEPTLGKPCLLRQWRQLPAAMGVAWMTCKAAWRGYINRCAYGSCSPAPGKSCVGACPVQLLLLGLFKQ